MGNEWWGNVYLGLEIKRLRRQLGISQDMFAWKIGVSQGTLAKYELDKLPVPYGIAYSIQQQFRVDFMRIFDAACMLNIGNIVSERLLNPAKEA